ncbi:subclass B1 metallo-beta-lactamase [Anaerophaga thermohalophila]|uniref:subclass B1 metallo-beta-lactamase n=1 Tax=Anaerophaga thermohalophila TaxID=177400 RepID=UPI0002E16A5A|nr:subclass B1 metallo-beta-lactamase [Anaerophaga thermohalophila]
MILIFGLIGLFSSNAQSNEKIVIDNDIQLIHLQDSVYVHVTWHHLDNFGRFPSNGLIVIRNGQALMIDTPMDNDKTERLTKYLKVSMSVDLAKLIIGHFHDDCMGGLGYLQSIGIESIANSMTIEKCKEIGLPIPSTPFTDSLTFNFNGEQIDCRFFGAGHSFDNITVWIPNKKILFGGCLIKSIDSKGLGNLSDAVVNDWDTTVEKVMKKYPEIKTVIPGHGDFGGIELLSHTIELVDKEKIK